MVRPLLRALHDRALMLGRERAGCGTSPSEGVLDSQVASRFPGRRRRHRRQAEKTFGWRMRWRCLVRVGGARCDESETMIHLSMGSVLLRRAAMCEVGQGAGLA